MAEPSLGDVHVDSALTDFSVAYFQGAEKFTAREFSPIVQVPQQSDKYFVYNKADTLRSDATKRAPNTESAVRTFSVSTAPFFCDRYSIAVDVSEMITANADPAVDPEEDAARQATQDLMIRMDVDFAATAFVTGVWGTSNTPTVTWDDASSTPIEDISVAVDTVESNTGQTPNSLLLGAAVWRELRNHPDIIARLPDNAPKIANEAFLANLFGFDRVVVARAIRNTADEGATASYSRIATDTNALVAYVDPNAGLLQPTAMKTFMWTGLTGTEMRTKRLDIAHKDALPRIEVDAAWDFKITGSDLGYAFITAVPT